MKVLAVFTTLVVVATAQFDISGFGRSGGSGSASPVYGPPQKEFEEPKPQEPEVEEYTPQIFRHVFVHSAPDEPVDEQARTIRIPGGDKHVNIIFVKTPSSSSSQQTEVILPEQDEQKNLVYVLLKKAQAENNIKIRRPQAKGPQKPEVYFIQYKDQEEEKNGGYSQGPAAPPPSQNGGGYQQRRPQNGNGAPHHAPPQQSFDFDAPSAPAPPPPSPPRNGNGNGHGNGHANGNGNGNGHANGNGNGHRNGNGGGNGYSEAGRYTPALAPAPILTPNDVPSSNYGVPL